MKRTLKTTGLALCLAAVLAACTAAPAEKDIAAPEYPWTNNYDQTVALLEEQGADFTADPGTDDSQPSIQLDGGTLFGVDATSVSLGFTRNGELTTVLAQMDTDKQQALQTAMEKAMGDPADSYQPVTTGSELMDAPSCGISVTVKRIALDDDHLLWHSEQPLSQTWSQDQQETWKKSLRTPLLEAGGDMTSKVSLARRESQGDVIQYTGDVALDAYLEYQWEKTAELYRLDDGCQVILNRTCIPML